MLECLNAALDHRGELFVPELNRTFRVRSDDANAGVSSFRLFAAQNPMHEGGGRRGLPRSFLNRFVIVQCEQLTVQDYSTIIRRALHDELPTEHIGMLDVFSFGVLHVVLELLTITVYYIGPQLLDKLVRFASEVNTAVLSQQHLIATQQHHSSHLSLSTSHQPEFNLRDLLRCCDLVLHLLGSFPDELRTLSSDSKSRTATTSRVHSLRAISAAISLVYGSRFTTTSDLHKVRVNLQH